MAHHHGRLPLVGNPLLRPEEKSQLLPQHSHHSSESKPEDPAIATTLPLATEDEGLHDLPAFHRHAEATTVELFFDLFFVANLTTFTANHAINDKKSLSTYIGFFCMLWFTWYQISLYDVRFASDSIFDRCCKAVQFGVMTGFAVLGPQFKPDEAVRDDFKNFSLLLMTSRFVLALQYIVTLWHLRKYKKTHLPLGLITFMTIAAGFVYLGVAVNYSRQIHEITSTRTYISWYVVAVLETTLTTSVSCIWRIISFKGTHFVQRMSLLTLIILGEGIIVLCKSISYIVKFKIAFDPSVIGNIVAVVLIIYFLYMLYFDKLEEEHFGTVRQQIWGFVHFPLHITLVLLLAGAAVWISYRTSVVFINSMQPDIEASGILLLNSTSTKADYDSAANSLNYTAYFMVLDHLPYGTDGTKYAKQVNSAVKAIMRLGTEAEENGTFDYDSIILALLTWYEGIESAIFDTLGLKAPKSEKTSSAPLEQLYTYGSVLQLAYVYFFLAAGLAIIFLGKLAWMSNNHKTKGEYVRIGSYFVVGLGVALLSLMGINIDNAALDNFTSSPWVLPTLCLCLALVVAINYVKSNKNKRINTSHGHGHH